MRKNLDPTPIHCRVEASKQDIKQKYKQMAIRGRPKGSKSFVNVDMETLGQYFGAKQHIPVSRVWLEKMNIVLSDKTPNVVETSVRPTTNAGAIQVKLSD